MLRTFGLIVLIATMTSGCTPVKLAPETEERIRNIGFKEDVAVYPPKGLVNEPIGRFMKHHGIDLGAILLTEFQKQVVKHPKFRQKSFGPSSTHRDAMFELEVTVPIASPAVSFSDEYVLRFDVWVRLVAPDGEKLWEAYDYPTGLNSQLRSHTAKELNDPKHLEDALRKISEVVVAMLMERL